MKKPAKNMFSAFVRDEQGATVIEYGLIVALIFLAILTSVNAFTDNTNSMYSDIVSAMTQ